MDEGEILAAETAPIVSVVECPCCGDEIVMRHHVVLTEVQLLRAAWVEHFGVCDPDWRAEDGD